MLLVVYIYIVPRPSYSVEGGSGDETNIVLDCGSRGLAAILSLAAEVSFSHHHLEKACLCSFWR